MRYVAVAVLVLVGGCSSGDVPWDDYASNLRPRIDALASERDCAGLQHQFDMADSLNEATMARTGHNNAALMKYVDGQMREAGCY